MGETKPDLNKEANNISILNCILLIALFYPENIKCKAFEADGG